MVKFIKQIQEEIINKIVEFFKVGIILWWKLWSILFNCGILMNIVSGKVYWGINLFLFELYQQEYEFICKYYVMFKQWCDFGVRVEK